MSGGLVLPDVKPDWRYRPDGDVLAEAYPPAAARDGISGKATVTCVVAPDGLLRDCKLLSEEPAGAGFGQATLSITPHFQMNPAIRDGVPQTSTVRIPLVWQAPETAEGETVEAPGFEPTPQQLQMAAAVSLAVALGAALLLAALYALLGRRRVEA
jgi:TonB family protein